MYKEGFVSTNITTQTVLSPSQNCLCKFCQTIICPMQNTDKPIITVFSFEKPEFCVQFHAV